MPDRIYSVSYKGRIYDVRAPENVDPDRLFAAVRAQAGATAPKEEEVGGFFDALMEGIETTGLSDEAAAFAANPTEENRRALIEAGTPEYRQVGFGEGENWAAFKQVLGSSIGQMAAPVAAGLGTSLVSTPLGGLAAFSGVAGAQYTAQNLLRQAQEQEAALARGQAPEDTSVLKAVGAAAGQTGLDLVGGRVFKPIAKLFPFMRPLLGEGGEKAAREAADVLEDAVSKGTVSFAGGVAKGVGLGVAFEVPQEIVQSGLERWQAGLSLTDDSALSEYKQAAIGAALLGGGFGGVSGALSTRGERAAEQGAQEPGATLAPPSIEPSIADIAKEVFTTPEQMAEFEALTNQYVSLYGFPEEQAAQLAMGALRPTPRAAAEAEPEVGEGEVSSAVEPTVAPAPTRPATVEPAPIIPPAATITPEAMPPLYHGGRRGLSAEDVEIVREPGATKQGKKNRVYGGFYATANPEEAQGYAEMAGEGNTVYEVQLRPDAVVEQKDGDITRLTPKQIEEYRARGVDVVVGTDVRGRTEYAIVNKDAVAGLRDTQPSPEAAPNAIWANADFDQPVTVLPVEPQAGPDGRLYQPVSLDGTPSFVPVDQLRPLDVPTPAPTPTPTRAPAPVTLSLPDVKKKVTPERISAARDMITTALAMPEFEGVEITKGEITAAANKMARTPGLEAPAALTDVLGIDAMEAAEAAPEVIEAPTEPVVEAPTEAPAPLDVMLPEEPAVPVTKVAPGDARGARSVQRGTQGTQRGRPVEGAAQLTEGMKAQQDLAAELQAARDAREITDQEAAEALGILRAPRTQQELRELPIARRNQWVEVNALQKQVDDLQQQVNAIPKEVLGQPNPARADMEAALGGVQQRLNTAQQGIVNEARAVFEAKRTGRKAGAAAIRERLRDKNLTPKERRDLQISLRETAVQRAQDASGEIVGGTEVDIDAFRGRTLDALLNHIASNVDGNYSAFDARLADRLNGLLSELQNAGFNITLHVLQKGDSAPSSIARGTARGTAAINLKNRTVDVYLRSPELGNSGASTEIILHEALHAVSMGVLLAARNGRGTPAMVRFRKDLNELRNKVIDHFNRRVRSVGKEGLTDFERSMYTRNTNAFVDADEFLAWGMTNELAQEYLRSINIGPTKSLFDRFIDAFRALLNIRPNDTSALAHLVDIVSPLFSMTAQDYRATIAEEGETGVAAIESGPQPKKDPAKEKMDKGLFKAQMANDAAGFTEGLDEVTTGVKLEAKEKRKAAVEAMESGLLTPAKLVFQPTSWIRDAITKIRPGLGSIMEEINRLEQNMRGMRTSMERAMRRRVKELENFVNKYGQGELSAAMIIARVNRVDMTAYANRAEALAKDPVMQHHLQSNNVKGAKKRAGEINTAWDAWEKLGKQKGGHEIYKKVRQFYKDMYAALRAAQDEDIRNLGLDKDATEKLIREARGDIDEDALVDEGAHKGVPESLFPKEYFPARRFGDHVLLVKADKRSERERYHFESARERNEFQMKRAKQLGVSYDSDIFTQLQGLENIRDNIKDEGFLLGKLFAAIDDAKTPEGATPEDTAKFRKNMKDRLYQTYLMTLPERSLRKQFIHAELVTGQSADVLRIFRVAAGQYAGQLPKVIYGGQIQKKIEAAYDSIKEGPASERLKLTQMVNTIVSRTRDAIDPPQRSWLEQKINEFTFVSLMTSIASAAVQPLTLPFQVMPRMVARYGPMQALKMVSSYTPLLQMVDAVVDVDPATGARTLGAPTIGNTPYVKNNPLRARLWKELDQKRDLFSQKQVDMLLRNRASPGTSGATLRARAGEKYDKFVTASGALFSSMDQLTREISGMSFAELEYNKQRAAGKSHEAAIEAAVEAAVRNTNETIGDYTEVEKLGVFRGDPLRRMMGFLRTYSVQRTAYYFRMLGALMNGSPTQTKRQAFYELSAVLSFTALGAGVGANFGYGLITDIIDLVMPLFMDEDEMEEWRRLDPLGADSADYRFRFQWLPSQFGPDSMATRIAQRGALSEITGYDWTTRLSQSDLWLRDFQKGDNLRETTLNFLATNLSPQISQGANILDGVNEFMEGNWSKGFTKIMPAAVRGAFTAERFATEGETTKSGMSVREADKFTTNELFGQVLGFAPNELARVREVNRKTQAWMRAMDEERDDLFKEYRDILDDPDTTQEDIQIMIEKIKRYNAKVPLDQNGRPLSKYLIEPRDVLQSLRGRATREAKTEEGVTFGKGEREALFRNTPK